MRGEPLQTWYPVFPAKSDARRVYPYLVANRSQARGPKASTGPLGSLESRTATVRGGSGDLDGQFPPFAPL